MEQDESRTLPPSDEKPDASDPGRIGRAKEFVGEKYSAATDAVKEKYTAATDTVKEKYSAATDAVKERYDQIREKVADIDLNGVTEQVRSYVRSNPGKALLISIGVGFVVGLMLRRPDEDDD